MESVLIERPLCLKSYFVIFNLSRGDRLLDDNRIYVSNYIIKFQTMCNDYTDFTICTHLLISSYFDT